MPENDEFIINYKGSPVKVSTVLEEANIFFTVHLNIPITIAERLQDEEWLWYDLDYGDTPLAAEIGKIIEEMEI